MSVIGNSRREGFVESVGSTTETNFWHVFAVQSGTSHLVKNININIPSATVGVSMIIRDGSGTSAVQLTGSIPLMAKPDEGFRFDRNFGEVGGLALNSGSLNISINGNALENKTAYGYVDYIY